MLNKENRLCKARVKNKNPFSKFDSFEIVTVCEYNDKDGGTYISEIYSIDDYVNNEYNACDDPYYHVVGVYHSYNQSRKTKFISEFYDIDQALNLLLDLSGEEPLLISY